MMPVQQLRPPPPDRLSHPPAAVAAVPKHRRSWPWWLLGTTLLLVSIWALARFRNHAEDSANGKAGHGRDQPTPVLAQAVQTGDFPTYLDALGTVTALNTVTVRSRVDGQIITIAFTEGQIIHEGDLLAQIDPRPFQVMLDQAAAQLAKDEAALKNAQVELDRYRQAKDAIPQQQIDTQQATVDQNAASTKIDQSAIENAQLQLTYSRVTAPISGRIGLKLVDQGNIVHAADAGGIATITQFQPISVVFAVSRDALTPVLEQADRGIGLQVEAFDRDFTHNFGTGKVTAIDNQVDINTGTIRLKAEFQNENNALFPQQFVNARLLVRTQRHALIVPLAAVQRGPDGMYAYVVTNNEVEVRKIELGTTEGDQTVVSQGLADGELVVTDGMDKLQEKSKVEVRPSGKAGATSRPTPRAAGRQRSE